MSGAHALFGRLGTADWVASGEVGTTLVALYNMVARVRQMVISGVGENAAGSIANAVGALARVFKSEVSSMRLWNTERPAVPHGHQLVGENVVRHCRRPRAMRRLPFSEAAPSPLT